jgi:NitT/TauT family transport system substrate-binding protein
MRNKLFAFALAAGMAMLSGSPYAEERQKVTLLYTPVTGYVGAFVAKDQGFFEKHGLDVELQMAQNGAVILAGVISNSAQIGIPTPTEALQALDGGMDIKALATTNVFPSDVRAGIVVRSDSAITGAKDLAGKKVGVPGVGALLDVVMRKWLKEQGVDPNSLNIVEIILPQTSDVLSSNQVDAVASVDPFVGRAVGTSVGKVVGDYLSVIPKGTAASLYVATGDWVSKNPEAVRAIQTALKEAADFVRSNPEAARASIARYTTLPEAVIAKMPVPQPSAELNPEQLKFWKDVTREQGLVTGDIDLNAFVVAFGK